MSNYQLSNEAREDLRNIWLYGAKQWGIKQADSYTLKIDEMCEFLFENQDVGRNRPEIFNGLKSHPIGSHTLFYIDQEQTVYVIRILHQRMDYEQHLLN